MTSRPEHKRAPQRKWYANNAEKVRAKNRDVVRFRKHGLTKAQATLELERQHGRCMSCREPITLSSGVLDHDHATGKFRGWLCRKCNMVLGLIKEDKLTLRRLMAYLGYDRTQRNVYVMGSLRNPAISEVSAAIRAAGFEVWDDWRAASPHGDDTWQAYEGERGRTYDEALRGRAAENTYLWDRAMIDMCDVGVLVMPSGKSAHMEAGYMIACGKPVFMLQDGEPERFEVMPQFLTGVCRDIEALLKVLK